MWRAAAVGVMTAVVVAVVAESSSISVTRSSQAKRMRWLSGAVGKVQVGQSAVQTEATRSLMCSMLSAVAEASLATIQPMAPPEAPGEEEGLVMAPHLGPPQTQAAGL